MARGRTTSAAGLSVGLPKPPSPSLHFCYHILQYHPHLYAIRFVDHLLVPCLPQLHNILPHSLPPLLAPLPDKQEAGVTLVACTVSLTGLTF